MLSIRGLNPTIGKLVQGSIKNGRGIIISFAEHNGTYSAAFMADFRKMDSNIFRREFHWSSTHTETTTAVRQTAH